MIQKYIKLLSTGETTGLFQLESSGVRLALKQMKPNKFEDIIALVALYRPGPMNNIPIYNDCKNGLKKPDYIHESLEKNFETNLWNYNLSRTSYANSPSSCWFYSLGKQIF